MANASTPGPIGHDDDAVADGTGALTESPAPGPIGIDANGARDDAGVLARLDWKALGFEAPPFVTAAGGRRLFRVWGGTSLERGDPQGTGVFFSFTRPATRWQAERLFAIAEFGNACRFVSEFEAPPETVMLVGPVDPGDVDPRIGQAGGQVFILNPAAQRLVMVGNAARLEDDFGGREVYTGPRPSRPA